MVIVNIVCTFHIMITTIFLWCTGVIQSFRSIVFLFLMPRGAIVETVDYKAVITINVFSNMNAILTSFCFYSY